MRNSRITVRKVSGAVGAEIDGVDLAEAADGEIADIRAALNAHGVLFFHNQRLNAEQQKALARRFGEIFIHPNYRGMTADPEVVTIRREPGDTAIVGEEWHADTTMCEAPPMGAILYGIEVPEWGGDTLFASQAAAYEALSPGMKRMLEGLRAVHSDRRVAGPQAGMNARRSTKVREDAEWRETISLHPVVRTHPETGRKMLFVNHSYTVGFEGMSEAESRPLLHYLMEHGHRPEFTCRFQWRTGSVAFWDNRAVKHIALNDTGPQRRVMRRVQIAGDVPA
ncbi:TauD/TfdA dioxygenase family protein [Siccirubricoccus phaeus]|uniref:TauD/TfdA dioxygenase family protein n=1 Tax=Siccirubricoccus phaeus TaxID=2595053 RepID=UPI0011F3AB5A|nr:TauD/TfdA family dioxygenase [Siccirubricoccus phaeus]